MTLLIACLIIYQFDMNSWLYVVAAMLWAVSEAARWWINFNTIGEAVSRNCRAHCPR